MKKFTTPIALLIITLAFSAATKFVDVQAVGPNGTEVGLASINSAFHKLTGVNMSYYEITNLIGYLSILAGLVFAVLGLVQLIKRKHLKEVDREILALGGLYIVLGILYAAFEKLAFNFRPIIMEGEAMPEPSFPSSHTMLIVTVLISVAIICKKYVEKKGLRWLIAIVCILVSAASVALRLMSGVHWVSDIAAGLLISATLLSFYSAIIRKKE